MIQLQGHPSESLYREVLTKYADVVRPLKENRRLLAAALLDNWEYVKNAPIPEGVDEATRKEDLQRLNPWMTEVILEFSRRTILPDLVSIQPAILRNDAAYGDFLYLVVTTKDNGPEGVPEIEFRPTVNRMHMRLSKLRLHWAVGTCQAVVPTVVEGILRHFEGQVLYDLLHIDAELPRHSTHPPADELSWLDYNRRAFLDTLTQGRIATYKKTRTVYPDTLVCGKSVLDLVSQFPEFSFHGEKREDGESVGRVLDMHVYTSEYMPAESYVLMRAETNEQVLARNYVLAPGYLLDITLPIHIADMHAEKSTYCRFGKVLISSAFAHGTISEEAAS